MALKHLFLAAWRASLFLLCVGVTAPQAQTVSWRDQIGTFRVGLVSLPGGNGPDKERIRDAFSRRLDMPVEVVLTRDYPTLMDAQASGRIDYAVYSAMAYATASLLCECVSPFVLPTLRVDGAAGASGVATGQRLVIAGREDGGDLAASSGSGDFHALDLVRLQGVFPTRAHVVQTPSQEEAVALFSTGKVSSLLKWEFVSASGEGVSRPGDAAAPDVETVWRSTTIMPLGVHAVRRNLPGKARELLFSLMTGSPTDNAELYDAMEPVFNTGFVRAEERDVAPVITLVSEWIKAQRRD